MASQYSNQRLPLYDKKSNWSDIDLSNSFVYCWKKTSFKKSDTQNMKLTLVGKWLKSFIWQTCWQMFFFDYIMKSCSNCCGVARMIKNILLLLIWHFIITIINTLKIESYIFSKWLVSMLASMVYCNAATDVYDIL